MAKLSKLEQDTKVLIRAIAEDLPDVKVVSDDVISKKKIGDCENKVDQLIDLYELEIKRICPGGNLNSR